MRCGAAASGVVWPLSALEVAKALDLESSKKALKAGFSRALAAL